MPLVLITGGTGGLGSELVPRFTAAGYEVRIAGRKKPESTAEGVSWVRADLATGDGLEKAVAGSDVVVHSATSSRKDTWQIDVEGTERLLRAAELARSPHFFYISIVGVDQVPLGYYKAKLAAEKLITGSAVPYSILRATQFHSLLDGFLSMLVRLPIALLPSDFKFQPIDAGEVADRMLECSRGGPAGALPDLGGPEVRTFGDLGREWLKARRKRALLIGLPLPGALAGAFRAGRNCTPEHADGKITWNQWLATKYGPTP